MPKTDIKVKLVGEDGNAMAIVARVAQALKRGGHLELVDEFTKEAFSGDYNHLLATCLEYIVEDGCEDEEDDWGNDWDTDDDNDYDDDD